MFSGLVSSCLGLSCPVVSCLLLLCFVLSCLVSSCSVLSVWSCLGLVWSWVFSCVALPRLSFLLLLPFTTRENSNLPGQETKFSIKRDKNMSNNITKIIDFGTHVETNLIYPVSLAPTCTPFFACVFVASPFLQILCQNWDPVGDPKITLGAPRWPSELPRTSFGGDFLWTCFLHENRHPKPIQKVFFFGTLDVAKT